MIKWGAVVAIALGAILFLPSLINYYRDFTYPQVNALYTDNTSSFLVKYQPMFWLAIPVVVIVAVLFLKYRDKGGDRNE